MIALPEKCKVVLYNDAEYLTPWIKEDEWYTRLHLSITFDRDGNVQNSNLTVRDISYIFVV